MRKAFFITPFSPEKAGHEDPLVFEQVQSAVREAAKTAGIELVHPAEMKRAGPIIEQVNQAIIEADVAVAVLTGHNPNVLIELGVAISLLWTASQPVLLITPEATQLPFDLAHMRCLEYGTAAKLESLQANLVAGLRETIATLPSCGRKTVPDELIALIRDCVALEEALHPDFVHQSFGSLLDELGVLLAAVSDYEKRLTQDEHGIFDDLLEALTDGLTAAEEFRSSRNDALNLIPDKTLPSALGFLQKSIKRYCSDPFENSAALMVSMTSFTLKRKRGDIVGKELDKAEKMVTAAKKARDDWLRYWKNICKARQIRRALRMAKYGYTNDEDAA